MVHQGEVFGRDEVCSQDHTLQEIFLHALSFLSQIVHFLQVLHENYELILYQG